MGARIWSSSCGENFFCSFCARAARAMAKPNSAAAKTNRLRRFMVAYLPRWQSDRIYTTHSKALRVQSTSGSPSAPAQEDADIARHAARIVDDLEAHVIAARLELALPEVVDLLGNAGECLLPAFLSLVDGASVVGADMIGKAEHLDGRHAVLDRAVDDDCRLFHDLVVRQAGGPGQPVEQRLLLGLRRFMRLHRLGRFLALHLGDLRHQFLGAEYVRHDASPWVAAIPGAFKGPASGWRSGGSCVPRPSVRPRRRPTCRGR